MVSIDTMVYTRSQKNATLNAARILVTMKNGNSFTLGKTVMRTPTKNTIVIPTPGFRLARSSRAEFTEPLPSSPTATTTATTATATTRVATRTPTSAQFWSTWSTWYSAFVSEIQDEGDNRSSITLSRAEARWTTFAAKTLRCQESQVTDWLSATPSTRRLEAVGL
jgi:hypothetical protein